VPMDVAAAQQEVTELAPRENGMPRRELDDEAIKRAAQLLGGARKPLVLAGGGAISAEAGPVLHEVAARLGAPVITTVHGRGVVPDDDPLSLGDGWSRLDFFDPLLAEADVCLAVGTSFGTVNDASRGAKLPEALVQIDIDPSAIGRHRPTTIGIVGDAKHALEQLGRELTSREKREVWCDVSAWRQVKRTAIGRVAQPVLDILDALREALPRDAIVADDLCIAGYWAPLAFDVFEPRTLLHPGMWGTLGYALPAAIGAQIGRPDRTAVALCGDGGFLYTSQELGTALTEGVNVIAIVFNDHAYGALKLYQDRLYRGRRIGVELRNPDFAKLGEAYGARGVKLRDPGQLTEAVREAVERGGLTVIECPVDFDAPPPWMP
jgi:acetolactate synthase-1/2/3 large subunit